MQAAAVSSRQTGGSTRQRRRQQWVAGVAGVAVASRHVAVVVDRVATLAHRVATLAHSSWQLQLANCIAVSSPSTSARPHHNSGKRISTVTMAGLSLLLSVALLGGVLSFAPRKIVTQIHDSEVSASVDEVVADETKRYVVVGAGWGGWGAAKALSESGLNAQVTLIDALPDPTGAMPYLSSTGKPVEAGTRGFWKDYPNINQLCAELGLDEDEVFTPFTNSSFYSPDGLEATAPVFSEATLDSILDGVPLLGDVMKSGFAQLSGSDEFPQLPSPLGQVLATIPYFERLPIADRASMVGLLLATIDCLGGSDDVKMQYDRMTAHELFLRFKLSERLVNDFLKPTLLVGLFKPPEELSALVVMELLYYYALAHQDSFDVRWIRNGTVADSLIQPMAAKLIEERDLTVLGGCRVNEISLEKGDDGKLSATKVSYFDVKTKKMEEIETDGVVLALGCKGMESVINSSPGRCDIAFIYAWHFTNCAAHLPRSCKIASVFQSS